MVLGSNKPLIEVSGIFLVKRCRRAKLIILQPTVSRFSRKCGSLVVSQPHGHHALLRGQFHLKFYWECDRYSLSGFGNEAWWLIHGLTKEQTSPLPYACILLTVIKSGKKKTPWSESASELYRPTDRRLSAKWLPTCADRRCHAVSVTDPCSRILGFIDRSRYFSIK
jgi:hypothetical protein